MLLIRSFRSEVLLLLQLLSIINCQNDVGNHFNTVEGEIGQKSEEMCKKYEEFRTKYSETRRELRPDRSVIKLKNFDCSAPQVLIVGGGHAKHGEFPHMALIGYQNPKGVNDFFCGGSLISEKFVLTAAHCKKEENQINIARFNTIRRNSYSAIDKSVAEFMIHPDYHKFKKLNDIALLELSEGFTFSKYRGVLPACLYTKREISMYKALATGWELSDSLLKVYLDISNCTLWNVESHGHICTNTPGQETCQDDSDFLQTPKIVDNEYACQMYIIGVTSYGAAACGSANIYGVFTKVADYIGWIESKVWQ